MKNKFVYNVISLKEIYIYNLDIRKINIFLNIILNNTKKFKVIEIFYISVYFLKLLHEIIKQHKLIYV